MHCPPLQSPFENLNPPANTDFSSDVNKGPYSSFLLAIKNVLVKSMANKNKYCFITMEKFSLNNLPLLEVPVWSLNTVHSSMVPKGENIILTSFSLYFLDNIPMNSFRSSAENNFWEKPVETQIKTYCTISKAYLYSIMDKALDWIYKKKFLKFWSKNGDFEWKLEEWFW